MASIATLKVDVKGTEAAKEKLGQIEWHFIQLRDCACSAQDHINALKELLSTDPDMKIAVEAQEPDKLDKIIGILENIKHNQIRLS